MIPGNLLSAFPYRQFHTLPGLLESWAALPNFYPNACMPMQGGSLYHFYDGLWYDPAKRRTHDLPYIILTCIQCCVFICNTVGAREQTPGVQRRRTRLTDRRTMMGCWRSSAWRAWCTWRRFRADCAALSGSHRPAMWVEYHFQAFLCQFWENAIFFNWEIKWEMIFHRENNWQNISLIENM